MDAAHALLPWATATHDTLWMHYVTEVPHHSSGTFHVESWTDDDNEQHELVRVVEVPEPRAAVSGRQKRRRRRGKPRDDPPELALRAGCTTSIGTEPSSAAWAESAPCPETSVSGGIRQRATPNVQRPRAAVRTPKFGAPATGQTAGPWGASAVGVASAVQRRTTYAVLPGPTLLRMGRRRCWRSRS